MPRPRQGYTNAAGDRVPGVHDVTNRYKNPEGLYHYHHQRGLAGEPFYSRKALDVGTVVHAMAELDLRGAADRQISRLPFEQLSARDDIDAALRCYAEFRAWRREHDVEVIALEQSMVSERHQFGGTPDTIAFVDGVVALIDLKTAKTTREAYLDQRVAMAAHGALWEERHPDRPVAAFHLLQLPKDGTAFAHQVFADLSTEWQMFLLQRDLLALEERQREAVRLARLAATTGRPPTLGESPKRRWERDLAEQRAEALAQPRLAVIAGGRRTAPATAIVPAASSASPWSRQP